MLRSLVWRSSCRRTLKSKRGWISVNLWSRANRVCL